MKALLIALAALAIAAPTALARPSSFEIERRTAALASELRCPVCQALSVRDSPSKVAEAMRVRIRDLVAAGNSDEEVREFFVARYGEWILLSPPRRGMGLTIWVLPPVVVLAGVLLVVASVRRWTRRARRLADEGRRSPEAVARVRTRIAGMEPAATRPPDPETR